MARYVKFPGTAGSYASTDDVNLMDADSMNLVQSIGGWIATANCTVAKGADLPDGFGTMDVDFTSNVAFPRIEQAALTVPLVDLQPVQVSMDIENLEATSKNLVLRMYLDAGVVDNNIVLPPGKARYSVSSTVAGQAFLTQIRLMGRNDSHILDAPASFVVSKILVSQTVAATFVPSLRIVGDLDVTVDMALGQTTTTTQDRIFSLGVSASNSWHFRQRSQGDLRFEYSVAVEGARNKLAPVNTAIGERVVYRFTRVASTGVAFLYENGVDVGTGVEIAGAIDAQGGQLGAGGTSEGATFVGDGYVFFARDGIGGPIVAIFDADDVPAI